MGGARRTCKDFVWAPGYVPLTSPNPTQAGARGLGGYLAFEEETAFLLKLAERAKATSPSGTSTTTCGRCTKHSPLCTPTLRRRSRTSRAPPSSGLPSCKKHAADGIRPWAETRGARGCSAPSGASREDRL